MVRSCGESEVIRCEEPAINPAVLILLDHCRATRRQEFLSRLAMAFLLMSSLAFFFFFRLPDQPTDRPTTQEHGLAQALLRGGKPHAHLTAPMSQCVRTSKTQTLAWETKMGLAHTQGFLYDQEKRALVVQSAGSYNIYLQITFRKPEKYECKGYVHLNAIVLANENEPMIMSVYDSLPCSENTHKSLFASGVYQLENNTQLMVNVSEIDLVDGCNEVKTYFGAFLLE
ncbi:hypothetical protein COCON_G00166990 [Conger conger]|uniref:THD domain-containing protein n=1 Tax=Conger conger TaxID=82655 RepID=A0A9Q1HTX0_CONCO|nr:tumor necrosis factor ligand superfamily member 15-like [Conger conger]KAJ8260976.1 hypothetical protein COCON_G00166990 [Conger conger]